MFDSLDKIVSDFFNVCNNTIKRNKKRKYTKRTFSEKDCDVYCDPTFLFLSNMPGEYVDYEEI